MKYNLNEILQQENPILYLLKHKKLSCTELKKKDLITVLDKSDLIYSENGFSIFTTLIQLKNYTFFPCFDEDIVNFFIEKMNFNFIEENSKQNITTIILNRIGDDIFKKINHLKLLEKSIYFDNTEDNLMVNVQLFNAIFHRYQSVEYINIRPANNFFFKFLDEKYIISPLCHNTLGNNDFLKSVKNDLDLYLKSKEEKNILNNLINIEQSNNKTIKI